MKEKHNQVKSAEAVADESSNYDKTNIAAIREKWAKAGSVEHKVRTLVQSNTSCEVEITKEGRRLCAEALLKW